jgi:hypothetical protein
VRRRPVRLPRAPARQTGVEAGGGDERVSALVVRVAVDRRRAEDELRAQPAQDVDDLILFFRAGAQRAVAQSEKLELVGAEDLGRSLGFAPARFGGAARPASPEVRCRMPMRRPARAIRASAPPQQISMSSGCAPIARTSTFMRVLLPPA